MASYDSRLGRKANRGSSEISLEISRGSVRPAEVALLCVTLTHDIVEFVGLVEDKGRLLPKPKRPAMIAMVVGLIFQSELIESLILNARREKCCLMLTACDLDFSAKWFTESKKKGNSYQ